MKPVKTIKTVGDISLRQLDDGSIDIIEKVHKREHRLGFAGAEAIKSGALSLDHMTKQFESIVADQPVEEEVKEEKEVKSK